MAELYPLPLRHHLRRCLTELRRQQSIYDLPAASFWRPDPELDLSVEFHGMPAATVFGPAAGPQDQLIQNIVLCWLGGSRIVELKTVQIMDELKISRPCIYAGNVGFNVEWSQELRLGQSLREYVGASMLLDVLEAENVLGGPAGPRIFDMSVGYDLKGISTPEVTGFVRSMMDATAIVDELRSEIPDELAKYRDFDFKTALSKSITLSTFHGCPKDEIERIVHYILTELGCHAVIKLNPTQLERPLLEHLLNEKMGYEHLTVNPKAWETSLSLDEAVGIVERLEPVARSRGLDLGVKFSNTLEVLNDNRFLPDPVMYMSGPPLHVIATTLVEKWREKVGDRYPVTFAAGIDRENFPDAVSLGLGPITSCTDLLKTRGYARQVTYLEHLQTRMKKLGVRNLPDFILKARGQGEAAVREEVAALAAAHPDLGGSLWGPLEQALLEDLRAERTDTAAVLGRFAEHAAVLGDMQRRLSRRAALKNTPLYAAEARENPRYGYAKNSVAPKKIGSALYLFDCLACNKCVPVCPNDANFTYAVEAVSKEYRNFKVVRGQVLPEEHLVLKLDKSEQWAVYTDFCNECGNCDVYCPEDGGPFMQKPKFFGTLETWERHADRDGFFVERAGEIDRMRGRLGGRVHDLAVDRAADRATFSDGVVELVLDRARIAKPLEARLVNGPAEGHVVDMKAYLWMECCLQGVLHGGTVNYVNIRTLEGQLA